MNIQRSALGSLIWVFGCTEFGADEDSSGVRALALDAFCEVEVSGIGTLDMEADYLPHVIQCENGGAGTEALKAQAVASRSYAYYKIETSGFVTDGTGDQVFSCGAEPAAEHYEAVDATSGQILTYSEVTVAAFFVAGADPGNRESCVASELDDDPTITEQYVTYNEGLSGDGVHQTTLGWVNPANYRNRGCMSQWGGRCLDERGEDYETILRFYYGADIGIESTSGPCIGPLPSEDGGADGGRKDAGAPERDASIEDKPDAEEALPDDVSGGCGCSLGSR